VDVLLATVASDSHTWNLIYLELAMRERGHRVTNLGPCVPDDLLVESCLARRPNVVVISSVNGHGRADGERVINRLRAHPSLADLPVVIGGKLGTDGTDHTDALTAAGFDAVFADVTDLDRFWAFLESVRASVAC
jgi:methylmalonyl-CoA mutase cobalamin-binding subunit